MNIQDPAPNYKFWVFTGIFVGIWDKFQAFTNYEKAYKYARSLPYDSAWKIVDKYNFIHCSSLNFKN